jgi:hypothetical protein
VTMCGCDDNEDGDDDDDVSGVCCPLLCAIASFGLLVFQEEAPTFDAALAEDVPVAPALAAKLLRYEPLELAIKLWVGLFLKSFVSSSPSSGGGGGCVKVER